MNKSAQDTGEALIKLQAYCLNISPKKQYYFSVIDRINTIFSSWLCHPPERNWCLIGEIEDILDGSFERRCDMSNRISAV